MTNPTALIERVLELDAKADKAWEQVRPYSRLISIEDRMITFDDPDNAECAVEYRTAAPELARELKREKSRTTELEGLLRESLKFVRKGIAHIKLTDESIASGRFERDCKRIGAEIFDPTGVVRLMIRIQAALTAENPEPRKPNEALVLLSDIVDQWKQAHVRPCIGFNMAGCSDCESYNFCEPIAKAEKLLAREFPKAQKEASHD